MEKTQWHYLENQFDNATKRSRKRMNIIINEHLASLDANKSDMQINDLYARFQPVHQAFTTLYNQWKTAKGIYKGATSRYEELLGELSAKKIAQWDNKIKVEAGENSSDYKAILPNARTTFQEKGRDGIINEVKSLAMRLENYKTLENVKTEVENFHQQMEQSRHLQQTKEEIVQTLADELEMQRVATAKMLYGNLGILMDKYRDYSEQVARYFNLEVLQQKGQEEEEVETLNPSEAEPVADPTIA